MLSMKEVANYLWSTQVIPIPWSHSSECVTLQHYKVKEIFCISKARPCNILIYRKMNGKYSSNESFAAVNYSFGVGVLSRWGQTKNSSKDHSTQTSAIPYSDMDFQTDSSCISIEHAIGEGTVNSQEVCNLDFVFTEEGTN